MHERVAGADDDVADFPNLEGGVDPNFLIDLEPDAGNQRRPEARCLKSKRVDAGCQERGRVIAVVVPGAIVTLHERRPASVAPPLRTTTATTRLPLLATGVYTLRLQATGFKPTQITGVELDVDEKVRVDARSRLETSPTSSRSGPTTRWCSERPRT